MASPWDRQDGEPVVWFDRFDRFRLLGSGRTIEAVWRAEAKVSEGKRPSPSWYDQSARWRWKERAEAWDESMRPQRETEAEQTRLRQLATTREVMDRILARLKDAPVAGMSFLDALEVLERLFDRESRLVQAPEIMEALTILRELKQQRGQP